MKVGDTYYQNEVGKATFYFKMEKDGNMYRCEKITGEVLFTNKLEFIKDFLKQVKTEKQLSLF